MLKNITFSVDEDMIKKARQKATLEKKSLNEVFRLWMEEYVGRRNRAKEYNALMKKLSYVNLGGGKLTREQMHER